LLSNPNSLHLYHTTPNRYEIGITLLESDQPINTKSKLSQTWNQAQAIALAQLFNEALQELIHQSPKVTNSTTLSQLTNFQGVHRFHKGGPGSSNELDAEGFKLFAEILETICRRYVAEASEGDTSVGTTMMATNLLQRALFTAMAPNMKVILPLGDFWEGNSADMTAEMQLENLCPNLIQIADNVVMAQLLPNSSSGAHFAYDVGYNLSMTDNTVEYSLLSVNENGQRLVQQNLRNNVQYADENRHLRNDLSIADLLKLLQDGGTNDDRTKLVGAMVYLVKKNLMLAQITSWNHGNGEAYLGFTGTRGVTVLLSQSVPPEELRLVAPNWYGDHIVFVALQRDIDCWTLHRGQIRKQSEIDGVASEFVVEAEGREYTVEARYVCRWGGTPCSLSALGMPLYRKEEIVDDNPDDNKEKKMEAYTDTEDDDIGMDDVHMEDEAMHRNVQVDKEGSTSGDEENRKLNYAAALIQSWWKLWRKSWWSFRQLNYGDVPPLSAKSKLTEAYTDTEDDDIGMDDVHMEDEAMHRNVQVDKEGSTSGEEENRQLNYGDVQPLSATPELAQRQRTPFTTYLCENCWIQDCTAEECFGRYQTKHFSGVLGYQNIERSCYANAALQMLMSIEPLILMVAADENSHSPDTTSNLETKEVPIWNDPIQASKQRKIFHRLVTAQGSGLLMTHQKINCYLKEIKTSCLARMRQESDVDHDSHEFMQTLVMDLWPPITDSEEGDEWMQFLGAKTVRSIHCTECQKYVQPSRIVPFFLPCFCLWHYTHWLSHISPLSFHNVA
jgi:hypothetical protein